MKKPSITKSLCIEMENWCAEGEKLFGKRSWIFTKSLYVDPFFPTTICKNHANICINLLLDFRQTIKLRHNFESYVRGHWVSHLCEKLIYHLLHWQFFNSRCLSLTQAMIQKQKSEHSVEKWKIYCCRLKKVRQINSLLISSVKTLLSRIFFFFC